MNDFGDKLDGLLDTLKTERDELRVKLHLLKAEVKDDWEDVEKSWQHLEGKLKQLKDEASESGEDVGAASRQLAEEIGNAYQRIRKSLR